MARFVSPKTNIVPLPEPVKKRTNWAALLRGALALPRRGRRTSEQRRNPFKPAEPFPGVVGVGKPNVPALALDHAKAWQGAVDAGEFDSGWLGHGLGGYWGSAYAEGQEWLGYAVLALLAQRPEYRTVTETFATEMTREWIRLKSKSEEVKKKKARDENGDPYEPDQAKQKKIDDINARLEELRLRYVTHDAIANDGYQGRFQIFIDTGGEETSDEELKTPIGDGRSGTKAKWGDKGIAHDLAPDGPERQRKVKIKRLAAIEPMWCYPATYNSVDPLRASWYRPDTWWVMGKEVHRTRLLTACSNPVPDMLKPAYSFGGLSRTQMAKPYVDFYLRNRTSSSDLLNNFSNLVLATDTSASSMDEGRQLLDRVETMNALRDNQSLAVINRDTEELTIAAAPLAGVKDLVAQSAEHITAPSRIPIVKYWGDQPSGLNASSEGVIRMFYDEVHAQQEGWLREPIATIVDLVQVELFGSVDDDLEIEFPPLWQLDEAGKAAIQKTKADTRAVDIEAGIVDGHEGRLAAARDPDSQYSGLDLHEPLPDPILEGDPMADPSLGGKPGETGPAAERGGAKGGPGFKPSHRDPGAGITSRASNFGGAATGGFSAKDVLPPLTASDL